MTRLLEYATLMGYLTTAQGDTAKADLEDFQRRRKAQPEEKPS